MRNMIDVTSFVNAYVIKRDRSMFELDIDNNHDIISKEIENKSILVIGGAGSIGSSFIRAILPFRPAELVVVDINENGLTELTRSLRASSILRSFIPTQYLSYPMDYSSVTFKRMFTQHRRGDGKIGFDIVANFSAHKHVRSEKDIYSIEALIRNNLINAKKLLDMMVEYPPDTYFCVSTDKAANPVNIMGASKRIMEDLIFSYSDSFPVKTARFANVAFSNGSLLEGFLERINQHQPISGPSDVKRYFVSLVESGQICMLATVLGNNREVFFPKLAEAQMNSFDTIAVRLLRSLGYEIEYCDSEEEAIEKSTNCINENKYPVFFSVSDTSGEKAYEEFFVDGEIVDMDQFESLGVVKGKTIPNKNAITELIHKFEDLFEKEDCCKEDIIRLIKEVLPNFEHAETGKSLDCKM